MHATDLYQVVARLKLFAPEMPQPVVVATGKQQ
jgi:hypothetical protein